MMNTMVMSVFERTREIGVLRALGWQRGQVMRLILGEALVLSLLGGLLGILLGVGMVQAGASMPGYGMMLTGKYSLGLFAQGMLTAVLAGHGRRHLSGLLGQQTDAHRGAALRRRCVWHQRPLQEGRQHDRGCGQPPAAGAARPGTPQGTHRPDCAGHRRRRRSHRRPQRHQRGHDPAAQPVRRRQQHGRPDADAARRARHVAVSHR